MDEHAARSFAPPDSRFDFAQGRRGRLPPHELRGHTGLPVGEIGGEVVNGESGGLFVGPMIGDGPEHIGVGSDFLGEGSPLDVAHDAMTGILLRTGEFASGDQRRSRRSGIAALGGHEVGKIQPSGGDADQRLSRLQGGFGGVLDGERVRARQAGDDQGFHGGKSSRLAILAPLGWYNVNWAGRTSTGATSTFSAA